MKKASDWMRELDDEFDAEERERREGHERSKRFISELCQAGLVDDVAPDGPIIPIPPLEVECGLCGARYFLDVDKPHDCPVRT